MSVALGVKTAVCGEYEQLLEASHKAMRTWNEERAAICDSGAKGREADLELLRAQAKYASTYARLQRHIRECQRCQFVTSMAGGGERTEIRSDPNAEVEIHFYD
jgi:hypothetical protein